MMRLKKIPFFLFLLPLFFCLHGWEQNYGFIGFVDVFKPGLVIFFCMALVTGLVYLLTASLLYASLVVFFISLWYLFFGAFYDWVTTVPYLRFLNSYPILLLLFFILTVCWIMLLRKRPRLQNKMAKYLNLLLLIYIAVDLFALLGQQHPAGTHQKENQVIFNSSRVNKKPNVYLLVFDGYPGSASLKDSFNFSNDSLYTYFSSREFNVLPVFSNYDLTYFSMSGLLNMQYVVRDFDPARVTQHDFQRRGVEIKNAVVFEIFRSMGYDIKNLSIFDVGDAPAISDKNSFLLAHSILLTDKILHNRLTRDMGDRLEKILPFWKNSDFYQHNLDNKLVEQLLLKTFQDNRPGPRFVYTHFMMPHGPYYYDSLGREHPYDKIAHHSLWKDKQLFISYLKYVNSKLTAITDSIIAADPNAIIMVMGDHGFRNYSKQKGILAPLFDNLCAVRFPGNPIPDLKGRLSLVNLFRFTLNSNFNQNIPYLADSSVVLRY